MDVRGRYRLQTPLAEGQLIRLGPYDIRELTLEAWRGPQGVRITRAADETLKGFLLTRKGREVAPHLVASDARWRYSFRGPLDLRYQDGHVLLARGDVVLIDLPMEAPPEEVYLDAECKLAVVHMLPCRPLPLYARRAGRLLLDSDRPNGLTWRADDAKGLQLTRHPDGSLELAAGKLESEAGAWTELTMGVGRAISLELRDLPHKGGFAFKIQGGRRHLKYYVLHHRGARVLNAYTAESGSRDKALEGGLCVDDALWVRIGFGVSCAQVDFSADGRHWGRLEDAKLEPSHPAGETVQFGVFLPKGSDSARARITRIRIHLSDALARLADPALVQRVPDGKAIRGARTLEEVWPLVARALPANVELPTWRLACDVALMGRCDYPAIRQACANDALETAVGHVEDIDRVLAAAEELAALGHSREADSPEWQTVSAGYERLARRCFAGGRRGYLVRLIDSWLNGVLPCFPARWDLKSPLPPGLVRLSLYHLLACEDWEQLAYQSGRMLALHRSARGELPYHWEAETRQGRLVRWMQEQARAVVAGPGDDLTGDLEGTWSHPLTVRLDRETLNVISEFIASIEAKAYEHAGRVLANQTLPDGIIPTDADGMLYQAIHFRIRQLIQDHPDLARLLRERFAPLGAIRLQRALRDGDVETLQSLAVQFHGTAPSREALHCLADRDLSMGNVFGAAEKYRRLLETPEATRRGELAAKHRLACALAGQLVGEPVRQTVRLPGKEMSAGEFEDMIASVLRSRRSGARAMVVAPREPLAPPAGTPRLSELCSLAADRDDRNRPFIREVAWALWGRNLIIHQRGRLTCVNLDDHRTLWSHQESLRSSPDTPLEPSWPIVAGDRLYVRLRARRGSYLGCFELQTGKQVWLERYDDGVVSDPILVDGWLYVLSCQTTLGGLADIHLRRVSPETGRSALAARLIGLRRDLQLLNAGRLIHAGDALLFRCSATLVCCDLLGEVRWIRRLTFIPPDIDASLLEEMSDGEPLVRDSHLVITCPNCPSLECVDFRTGQRIWSYLQPDLRKLVGLMAGTVILATEGGLEGIDAGSGKLLWQTVRTAEVDAVLPAEKDSVLCVTLERVDPKSKGRYGRDIRRLRWLSARDGSVIRTVDLADPRLNETLYDVTRLYATGREIVGLAAYDSKQRSAKVFAMTLK
jgi:outer membrane protein assembly factor BamB